MDSNVPNMVAGPDGTSLYICNQGHAHEAWIPAILCDFKNEVMA